MISDLAMQRKCIEIDRDETDARRAGLRPTLREIEEEVDRFIAAGIDPPTSRMMRVAGIES